MSDDERAKESIDPRFFTLDETALYLNVSRPQVYSLVRSGELPAIKIGGRGVWRVDRRQLEAYIDRLLKETQEWAKANPLAKKPVETIREDDEPEDESL